MNRILSGFLALIALAQVTTFSALNDVQAGRVASIVGNILEGHHFKRAKFDDLTSSSFLTNYLNALDYNHMFFLQSDIDNFKAKYGNKLDDLTKSQSVSAAFQVFDIYLERLEERNILVQKLLKQEFDFNEDESFIVARNKEPWPKDDAESAKLWRQRIKYELLQARLAKEKPEETIGLISRRYNRLEKTMRELKREDILQLYLTSLAHVYDPHSDYMSPSEAENFDIQHISLSLTGIGAQLVQEDGYTKIKDLIAGGPAALSKQLRPSDKIVAVAQGNEEPVDVVEMPLRDVVDLIRGKKGTEVKLTIVPAKNPDSKKVISLIRDEIQFKEQFAKARVYDYTDRDGAVQKIGVVTLPQFYDHCASHVETLIDRLKKENISALVLDLRRNGGGILDEAVQLTGLFIKKGPVVQVKEPRKDPHILNDSDSKVAWDGPLVIAVGKLSASASEIVAGALQDYGRAVVVGDQTTHGKGTVQQVLPLDSVVPKNLVEKPGKLKMTVSKFYRVSGTTTQKQGVTPDIVLPSIYDYLDIGEGALENALPADQTTPATYTALDQVKAFLPELQTASKVRVGQSKDFAYLMDDIEQVKKRKDEKSVSLNEKVRLAERDEDKARIEQRKKERAARTKPSSHIFELDLDAAMANQPLKPFDPNADKEEADLAQATPPTGEGSDAETEDLEAETDPLVDPHLDETIEITRHYLTLIGKGAKPGVALKNRAAAEKN